MKRCSQCQIHHPSVRGSAATCAPCVVFEMIHIERKELAAIVQWCADHDTCFYCGEIASEKEHVIPRHTDLPTWIVPSCRECNAMANGAPFGSALEKLLAIREKRRKKHAKLLRMPQWTADELREMGPRMAKSIAVWMIAKDVVQAQLTWNPLDVAAS